ncbi:MAG: ABC transporter permease [Verrucomicrobiota bacterium]
MHKSISAFSLFLSLRYLRPKRTVVSIITIISILGVALGVLILTVVIAVMTGFGARIKETVLGFEPHLTVTQSGIIYDWRPIVETAKLHPEVVDAAPYSHGQVVLDYNNRVWVVKIQGVSPQPGAIYDKLEKLVTENGNGEFDLDDDNIIIGKSLALGMGINLGDTVMLQSLANGAELYLAHQEDRKPDPDEIITPVELTVVGFYESGNLEYDNEFVFIPLEIGQWLYKLGPGAHGVAIQLEDPYRYYQVTTELIPQLEIPPLYIESWTDRNRALFEAVAMEKMMMYFLLFMIMVVAGFCIMNTMITVTTQKRREIGLMKAIGARTSQIVSVFLAQGIVVGVIGTALGLAAAMLFLMFRTFLMGKIAELANLDLFNPEVYGLIELPAKITAVDLMVISGGAFMACALSALIPAYFAARRDAANALRDQAQG